MIDIYGSHFLENLNTLKNRQRLIVSILSNRSLWNEDSLKLLRRCFQQPLRSDQAVRQDRFWLIVSKLLYGTGSLETRLNKAANAMKVDPLHVLEILFWANPKKFPLPSDELTKLIPNREPRVFVRAARDLVRKYGLKNFIELQAAIQKASSEDLASVLAREINSISIYNCHLVEEYREFIEYLDYLSLIRFRDSITHPYIRSILFRVPSSPVVIDGNNVVMLRRSVRDLNGILEALAEYAEFYYPFTIVFDANIKYVVPETQREFLNMWLESRHVRLHSPADEFIMEMSEKKKAVVISADRFSEWKCSIIRIDPRELLW